MLARPFRVEGLRALLLSEVVFAFFDGPPNVLLAPMILARTGNNVAVFAAVGMASAGAAGYLTPSLCHVEAQEPEHEPLAVSSDVEYNVP